MIRDWTWVAAALLAAALVGGVATDAVLLSVSLFLSFIGSDLGGGDLQGVLFFLGLVGVIATVVFLGGLLVVGVPVWMIMHAYGLRSPKHAVAAGALLAAGATLALSTLAGFEGLVGGLVIALLMIGPGAAAGWTLRRIAYRAVA